MSGSIATTKREITLDLVEGLGMLFGELDKNLRYIEESAGVDIRVRGNRVVVEGEEQAVLTVERTLRDMAGIVKDGHNLRLKDVKLALRSHEDDPDLSLKDVFSHSIKVAGPKKRIAPRTENQKKYVKAISSNDLVFGIGPAGTGKTYLAMAMAVNALVNKEVNRIILTRPAVEAGEKLGFLPGDLYAKVDPYLRPLYDALYDMMDMERIGRLLERGTIEVAPLAFMRGRTLNDSFIVLDEAQNTTSEQMKMFLTRMGFGSKAVVTGDITQVDLPDARPSGLIEVMKVLKGVDGINFTEFDETDVVRHSLVQKIVIAYYGYEKGRTNGKSKR
jgi:phosphate starvation-inducible PhoH-like protein